MTGQTERTRNRGRFGFQNGGGEFQRVRAIETPELDAATGNTGNILPVLPGFGGGRSGGGFGQRTIVSSSNPYNTENHRGNDIADGLNYVGRRAVGGTLDSLRGIANDISYTVQMGAPSQAAENAAAGGQSKYNEEARKAFDEYMASFSQNELDAMEITGTLPDFHTFLGNYVWEQETAKQPDTLVTAVDWGTKYNQETNGRYADIGAGWRFAGDVSAAVGGMLPAAALSFIPGAGGVLGKAALFSQARGNAMEQALANGAGIEDADAYGTAVGGIELATEALFDGLGMAGKYLSGKGVIGQRVNRLVFSRLASHPTAARAISRVVNGLGEGAEEYLAEWGGWLADKATIRQDERSAAQVQDDAEYAFWVGTVLSRLMQAADIMARDGADARTAMEWAAQDPSPAVQRPDLLTGRTAERAAAGAGGRAVAVENTGNMADSRGYTPAAAVGTFSQVPLPEPGMRSFAGETARGAVNSPGQRALPGAAVHMETLPGPADAGPGSVLPGPVRGETGPWFWGETPLLTEFLRQKEEAQRTEQLRREYIAAMEERIRENRLAALREEYEARVLGQTLDAQAEPAIGRTTAADGADASRNGEDFETEGLNVIESVENTEKSDKIILKINNGTALKSIADPMADVHGAGVDSNPEEIVAFRKELEQAGVQLIEHARESLGYCPGTVRGTPGTAYISAGASYSAWLHEMRHMRDDRDAGWLGMSIIADPDRRYEWEVRAYNVEIELALKADRPDIADKLRENLEKERRKIYGEQFN